MIIRNVKLFTRCSAGHLFQCEINDNIVLECSHLGIMQIPQSGTRNYVESTDVREHSIENVVDITTLVVHRAGLKRRFLAAAHFSVSHLSCRFHNVGPVTLWNQQMFENILLKVLWILQRMLCILQCHSFKICLKRRFCEAAHFQCEPRI